MSQRATHHNLKHPKYLTKAEPHHRHPNLTGKFSAGSNDEYSKKPIVAVIHKVYAGQDCSGCNHNDWQNQLHLESDAPRNDVAIDFLLFAFLVNGRYRHQALVDIEIYPEASSAYIYEQDSTEVIFHGFEFKLFKLPNLIFRPVNFDNHGLVVEAKLSVDVNIECSFSFSVYDSIDKDDVPMGSGSANIQTNLDVDILVSFIGDLDKIGAEVEVDDVEIEITTPDVIDFGEISPDWMDEDYDY